MVNMILNHKPIQTRVILLAAVIFLGSCSSAEPPASGRAGLVVLHEDGHLTSACVSIRGEVISGIDMLAKAQIDHTSDSRNPMGTLICEIESRGCSFPEESCLCRCNSPGGCAYWAYFIGGRESDWSYSPSGASMRELKDGDLDGWVWLPSGTTATSGAPASLSEITFEDVCPEQ